MYATKFFTEFMEQQQLQAPGMKSAPAFYRNLEQQLDTSRKDHTLHFAKPRWPDSVHDFTSGDMLSLNRSGRLREAFHEELRLNPDVRLGSSGGRIQYGNYPYLINAEKEIADFYKAETALIVHSSFLANVAVLSAIALPGDAYVYDELVHASTHEGMAVSKATHKIVFKHNDPDSLRDVLTQLKETNPEFKAGSRSIVIAVESFYSMDGDVAPLKEFVDVAKEEFPLGNAQFIIDEVHSTGIIGPNGVGLTSLLGLEDDIAIRVHGCGKALGSTGGIILCNQTVRTMMLNHARFIVYSGAPSFHMAASIRAGYRLMISGQTQKQQEHIQNIVKHFFTTISSNAVFQEATEEGILSIPLIEDWESRPFVANIVAVITRNRYETFLFAHLMLIGNVNAYAFSYPIVPKGKSRVRLVFHAHNSMEDVEALADTICDWAQEMLDIENNISENKLPKAIRHVYALQASA